MFAYPDSADWPAFDVNFSQLVSPADGAVRVAVRPLAEFLAVTAERWRYNPVYVGPVSGEEAVRAEFTAVLEGHGRSLVSGGGGSFPDAFMVVGMDDAMGVRQLTAAGVQVVVCGDRAVADLPADLAEWVAGGLAFDPAVYAGAAERSAQMAGVVDALVGGSAEVGVVVGDDDLVPWLVAECELRMRLGGAADVAVVEVGAEVVTGSGVVLARVSGAGQWDAGRLNRLRAAVGSRALLLVVGASGFEGLRGHGVWSEAQATGTACVLVEDGGGGDAFAWPDARDLLVGGGGGSVIVAEQLLRVSLNSVPLHELLQMVDATRRVREVYLVLYGEDRIGWLRIRDDEVVSAVRAGDTEEFGDQDALVGRVRAMSLWVGATAVVVPAPDDTRPVAAGSGFLLAALSFDLVRFLDEREAGMEHELPGLWSLKAFEVAEALVAWGLSQDATELLERAQSDSEWGVEEDLLLGYLSVDRDPTEALARLHHVAVRLAREGAADSRRVAMQVDATLDALLLQVRGRQLRAGAAWRTLDQWIGEAGTAWVRSARHAAILLELAVRAGRRGHAERFYALLVGMAGADHPVARIASVYLMSES